MLITFPNQTVLVTGAAHGFGRAMMVAFAQRGAHVFGYDLLEEELSETLHIASAAAAEARGGPLNPQGVDSLCRVAQLDVTDPAATQAYVSSAVQLAAEAGGSGAVDVAIHNAGGVLGQVGRPLEEVTAADWHAILDVNLSAAFWLAQAAAPAMKRAGRGRLITISSGAGLGPSLTGIQAYASAKAGLINLTRQLAHELGPFGITANSIAPGFVRSNANTERQWEAYGEEGQARLVESIALRRLGSVDDITHAALFLASQYAGWITGQVLRVDGG
jgi:3-oxoacyl-[acyl-carrier protein] reductase